MSFSFQHLGLRSQAKLLATRDLKETLILKEQLLSSQGEEPAEEQADANQSQTLVFEEYESQTLVFDQTQSHETLEAVQALDSAATAEQQMIVVEDSPAPTEADSISESAFVLTLEADTSLEEIEPQLSDSGESLVPTEAEIALAQGSFPATAVSFKRPASTLGRTTPPKKLRRMNACYFGSIKC